MVTVTLQVPVEDAMTFVFTTRQTFAVFDVIVTFVPLAAVILSRFKMDAWLTEITNLMSSSAVATAEGTVVEGGVVCAGGAVVGGVVVAGLDGVRSIFISETFISVPTFTIPAIR